MGGVRLQPFFGPGPRETEQKKRGEQKGCQKSYRTSWALPPRKGVEGKQGQKNVSTSRGRPDVIALNTPKHDEGGKNIRREQGKKIGAHRLRGMIIPCTTLRENLTGTGEFDFFRRWGHKQRQ